MPVHLPGVGLQVDFETPKELQEARRRSQVAEDRGERLKALEEPAIGLRFMANPQALEKMHGISWNLVRSLVVASKICRSSYMWF